MNNNSENYQIIGFDLGHGKTALASVSSGGNEAPEILEIQQNHKFVITALAYDSDNFPLIGDDAFEYAQTSQVENFEISFKMSPSNEKYSSEVIKKFVKVVYKSVQNSQQLDPLIEQYFFIGYPSGWLKEEADQYKQLMSDAGLSNVKVVPESRAAFMHAYDNKKINLNIQEIREGILIVDIGSSTTDLTFATEEKVEDFGAHIYALGASLIDKEIFKYNYERHENKEQIYNHFQVNPKDIKICEIRCRKVKEKYFRNIEKFIQKPAIHFDAPLQIDPESQRKLDFNPEVNYEIMESILDTKLPDLNNLSWKEAFREQLTIAKQKFEEKDIQPSKILVTGGGSRMNFTEKICREVFPDSGYHRDSEPEVCVARGLASWGRLDVKTAQFKKEIDNVLKDNLKNIVEKNLTTFKKELVDFLTNGLLHEVLKTSLIDFRDKRITGGKENLELEIEKRAEAWLEDISIRNEIINKLSECLQVIKKEVEEKIDQICQQYGLAHGTLDIEETKDSITFDQGVVDKLKRLDEDPVKLAKSITKVASILFSGFTFTAMIVIIQLAFEVVLATITSCISVILNSIILGSFFDFITRKIVFSERKIEEILRKNEPELRKNIKQELEKQPEIFEDITKVMINAIHAAIDNKVDDARILLD